MNSRRRVLLVSYHFPPDGAVGGIRPAKFAKYLGDFGWEPMVLTIAERHVQSRDASRLGDVSAVPVERTAVLSTPLALALRVKRRWLGRSGATANEAGPPPTSLPVHARNGAARPSAGSGRSRLGLLVERGTRLLDLLFEFPDKQIGWLLPALWRAIRLIRRHAIPIVLVTAPPRTAVLVGYLASALTGVSLVIDFRDPWQLPPVSGAGESRATRRALGWLERRLVRRAALILTTTPEYAESLQEAHPAVPPHRIQTLLNGFDEEDLRGLTRRTPDGRFVLSYLGTFYLERTPTLVLEAMADLMRSGTVRPDQIKIQLVGHVEHAEGRPVREIVAALGLDEVVAVSGPVPHREALQLMANSDALLLLAPAQYLAIPAKAFDYLGVGVPILCIADEGATSRLVRAAAAGVVVSPRDREGIRLALEALIRGRTGEARAVRWPGRAAFDRRRQVGRLASLLEDIVTRDSEGARAVGTVSGA